MRLFSLKMRASMHKGSKNKHISGAEKILSESEISKNIDSLIKRALYHSKGESDFINIKIEKIEEGEISYIESLPVRTIEVSTAEEGREVIRSLLNQLNIKNVTAIMNLFKETYDMRGAMLLDADTLERLEPDKKRGVRATYMDSDANLNYDLDYNSLCDSPTNSAHPTNPTNLATPTNSPNSVSSSSKNHFQEAIVLAGKVANAPNIIAEICVSDDPDYVTGYIAASSIGYVRITKLKKLGDSNGGRIFLYRGPHENVSETIRYLEEQKVIVKNVPKTSDNSDSSYSHNSFDSVVLQDSFQIQNSNNKPDNISDSKFDFIKESLDNRKKSGLYREMICIDSTNCTHVTVRDSIKNAAKNTVNNLEEKIETDFRKNLKKNNHNLLMLASNSYLGLTNDFRIIEAAKNALAKYGTGSGGSRLTTGNLILHEELEAQLARFKKTESALIFNTGYMANVGILSALGKKNALIFSDELNHASIIDGCRLSHAQTVIYRHNDMKDLEEKIRIFSPSCGIIVTDAVFSMDGDIANLPKILELSKRYNLISMIDEAHATGVIGETGRGITEYFNLNPFNPDEYPDILMGTLSKALAAEGGFVCGKKFFIDYLRNEARSFIFSTSLAPSTIAAAKEALSILESEPERVRKLRRNVKIFVETLQKCGINAATESAIIPIIIGDEKKAVDIAQKLFDEGIFISAIRYPSVKKGKARLRAAIMSEHKEEELKNAAEKIGQVIANIR